MHANKKYKRKSTCIHKKNHYNEMVHYESRDTI